MSDTVVTQGYNDYRLDTYCTEHSFLSRSKISEMIKSGSILLNHKPAKPKARVKVGDVITIQPYIPKETHIQPIPVDFEICYEDDYLMVVNKPRGLMVHPAHGVQSITLLNGLVHHFKSLGLSHTPGMVHRIDKDTEGLLVIAKDSVTHHALANQLLDKTLSRHYIAICHNHANFVTRDLDEPIGVNPMDATQMSIHGLNSKPATTHFKTVENHDNYCVLECILETGRTHQIRVHAAFMNHPLIGDKVYGPNIHATGQALCAYKLKFIHPVTQKNLEFIISYENTLKYARGILL